MEKLETTKKSKIEKPSEEIPSLEELVSQKEKEIERGVKEIQKTGEKRIEHVAESIGVSEEEVGEEKKKMVFEKREGHILGKIKELVGETKEKINSMSGKEIELGEEDIEIVEEKYEPFDPAEEYENVQKIVESGASTALKERMLNEYKSELMKQKEGIAKLQLDLRKKIEKEPDSSAEELMEKVNLRAPELRLAENQKKFFKDFLDTYEKKHELIKETREKYPNDKKLFEECFGFKPKGKVKVLQGPMSFYFKCSNPEDFSEIFYQKSKGSMDENMMEIVENKVKGVAPHFSKIESLKENVILENSNIVPKEKSKLTRKHEEQHVWYDCLRKERAEFGLRLGLVEKQWYAGEKEEALVTYLRDLREEMTEDTTKNETLARLINNEELAYIRSALMGQHYHILEKFGEELEERIKKLKLEEVYNKQLLAEATEEVFKNEYEDIVDGGLKSLYDLKKMGMDNDKIIELLVPEHMEQWPNIVRRLKQEKKKK